MELVGLLKTYTNYGFQIFFFTLAIVFLGAVIAAIRRKPRIFYLSALAPFIAVAPMLAAKFVIADQLAKAVSQNIATVQILPKPEQNEVEFMNYVWRNFSTWKRRSGSQPLAKGPGVWICIQDGKRCEFLVISQDSKDSELYWVIFDINPNMKMTLGYTRLDKSVF